MKGGRTKPPETTSGICPDSHAPSPLYISRSSKGLTPRSPARVSSVTFGMREILISSCNSIIREPARFKKVSDIFHQQESLRLGGGDTSATRRKRSGISHGKIPSAQITRGRTFSPTAEPDRQRQRAGCDLNRMHLLRSTSSVFQKGSFHARPRLSHR